MEKYTLYIGSNNKTKRLEYSKILNITLEYFPQGFTAQKAQGIWKGGKENTAIVTISTEPENRPKVYMLAQKLKTKLEQQAIMVEFTDSLNYNFI